MSRQDAIYQNIDASGTPALPTQASQDVVYADLAQIPSRSGRGGLTTTTRPVQSDEVVYADLDLIASNKPSVVSQPRSAYGRNTSISAEDDDKILYADMSHLPDLSKPSLPQRAYKQSPENEVTRQMSQASLRNEYVNTSELGLDRPELEPGQMHATWTNHNDKQARRVILQHIHPELIMIEIDNDMKKTTWVTNTLRGFGQKSNLFAFEAGRRSSTGEGIFKFTIDGGGDMAEVLKKKK